jgi:hypothetical protein
MRRTGTSSSRRGTSLKTDSRTSFVLRSLLGYSLPVPEFFELSESKGQTRACRVRFEVLGGPLRPVLHKPTYTPLVPSAVEQLFKVKLDAPNRKEHP